VSPSEAIVLGMVPLGGLFVPESVPVLDPAVADARTYQETARLVMADYLSDFSSEELTSAIDSAYNETSFDTPDIVELFELDSRRGILELWHGPTAAFKDMALQIMPSFLQHAKIKTNDKTHTVILVATSGDTGKAALEGFKDREGVSIIVFYPHEGVSEIQRLQMATTEGSNTHVVAVRGNFDDCQNGVKALFADAAIAETLKSRGLSLSSANSINWGRLCPQIAYYVRAYYLAVRQGSIKRGEAVNFCVPTGNFGNILAGWYARAMGLPIRRLICASNRNRVLADFFATGTYDRRREFFRTASPSMDILISSNLERFLFEITGRNGSAIAGWFADLAAGGIFKVDAASRAAFNEVITAGWADDDRAAREISSVYASTGYVLDTHTAVAVAVGESLPGDKTYTIIDATASPYKFGADVYAALTGTRLSDEFECVTRIQAMCRRPVHRGLAGLRDKPVRHSRVVGVDGLAATVLDICNSIPGK
jgi:threonine synthase